jgi:GNAT superfamily N-acetyltransferase
MACGTIVHPVLGNVSVGPVDSERTHRLRQQVLRPHQRVEDMGQISSRDPDGLVVGAAVVSSGEVVSTASLGPEEPPGDLDAALPPGRRWRLRGMATRPDLRGCGFGAAVLEVALGHVARLGGGVVWCSARVAATSFYERAGFRSFGDAWEAPPIGPHVHMWRTVEASTKAAVPAASRAPKTKD